MTILGPPSFNNISGSFAQSNSNVSGIFSATAANAVVGVSNNSMAGDLLHLGVYISEDIRLYTPNQ